MTTTCATCGRVVLPEHVDAAGNCVLCPAPQPVPESGSPTEEEWADIGRPESEE